MSAAKLSADYGALTADLHAERDVVYQRGIEFSRQRAVIEEIQRTTTDPNAKALAERIMTELPAPYPAP